MAQDDIQGTVTDSAGDPVEGAIVALIPNDGSNGDDVIYTTTDSNGDYIFDAHPQGDGTTQEWHVMARYDDGSGEFNSLSLPYVSADLPEGGTIPDSVVNRAPLDEGSGTSFADVVGSADGTLYNGGVWTDDPAFSGGTAPFFDQTDDYAEWQPRATTPITWTCRVYVPSSFDDDFPYPWAYDIKPAIRYEVGNSYWAARVGGGGNAGTVSDTPSDEYRILAYRLSSSEGALDVYDGSLNKIGSDSTSDPDTSFDSSTMYLGDRSSGGGDRPFGNNIDLFDVHDEYVSDIDALVSEVYG